METLDDHIQALAKRLKIVGIFFLVSLGVVFYFSSDILAFIQSDLGFKLFALTAYETLYTQLMIAFLGGFLLSLPVTLFEIILFMKPGLKEKEYRVLRNYLPFSILLFSIGSIFSYQYVVKTSLAFFQSVTDASTVGAVWGLQNTIGFALRLSAFMGIIFQLPIVAVILGKAGLINREMMIKYRSYFIVIILLISALATPPDMISQALVTLPVIGLYQISIYLVKRVEEKDSDQG